ncbi:MAG: hypothetical protein COX62_08875 [Deltaproteobacteria bacterium CG_4_10_14_0_2_um_filter_43_8]|nr:MAG: hypothetical protein COV43_07815 [Deltaproteobacteria bacterium CG11_big_fil_rev_8_21_14_0_20_42_23]PJA18313.1 MAG: hypothetical protein COX62_08875 [Deltaproteobacteria bacterium CG_4_10_14_0_2_um_filter_43_8]PJC63458.1 MAG: hypothetical protein CO021_09435 [Deltaproteobacteria bacterium CG_4_9_14_0_2_um_filter_42_21]
MKPFFFLLIFSFATAAHASEFLVTPSETNKISITLTYLQESMLILPEPAQAITGVSRPYFQIEPAGSHIMVRPLQAHATGNLFLHLRDNTLIALHLQTSERSSDNLVELNFEKKLSKDFNNSHFQETFPKNFQFFSQEWKVERLKERVEQEGLRIELNYLLNMGNMVAVHFSLQNKRSRPLELNSVVLDRLTLGGIKGISVLQATPIPHQILLSKEVISKQEKITGTLFFPSFSLDYDQTIRFSFQEQDKNIAEIRFVL